MTVDRRGQGIARGDFAAIAEMEDVLIDGETSLRKFQNELRWSEAAHMLGHA